MTADNPIDETQFQDAVYSLAAAPDFHFGESGLCFAARPSGLYRSNDGALTWQDAYAALKLQEALTTAVVVLSPDFETDRTVFAGVPGGVVRSTDGGDTWRVAVLPSPPPFVLTIAVSPNFERDGVLLAGTMEDGIFRSADRGATWAAWNFGLLDLNVLCLVISPDFATDETLFAGTDSGIFRSTNGGRAWREVDFSPDLAPVLCLAISPRFGSDGVLWAGTEENGLYRSSDGGQSWLPVGQETLVGPINSILLSPEYPARAELVVLAGDTLFVSEDDGRSWAGWPAEGGLPEHITAVTAPGGLNAAGPLVAGLADGRVLEI